ncbi:MAG TPA: DUF4097 family beta strand repeat-containing protein [Terriglobales bacterium]|nr:DUF4097 family beta strand repeat-containing protein [Terriglobales bacterium]
MRRNLIGALAILLGLGTSLAAAESYQGRFERRLQVSGPADLEVLSRSGDVTIRAGAAGSVTILGRIRVENHGLSGDRKSDVEAIEKIPPITQDSNSIRVEYVNVRGIAIDYEITVPVDSKVRSKSGSGNQTMEGLTAGLDVETGSGDVRLRNLAGEIHSHTGSGNVRAEEVAGPFEARAGSGDIRVEEKGAGDVQVETGSGNIELRGVDGGLRVSDGSGDVRAEGKPTNDWSFRTGSGNVELRVPGDAGFRVDISTGSGSVTVDHPITTTIQGRVQRPPREIRGQVRGGGPEIRVHTGSGNIHIY